MSLFFFIHCPGVFTTVEKSLRRLLNSSKTENDHPIQLEIYSPDFFRDPLAAIRFKPHIVSYFADFQVI